MAKPPPYTQSFNFAGYQTTNPVKPLPGVRVDIELTNIATSITGTQNALADIRRDDGQLKNGIVTPEALAPGMAYGVLPPVVWQTGTTYKPPQAVWQGNKLYQCIMQHVSTTFAADLSKGFWNLVLDFQPPINAAAAYAAQAAASAADAANSAAAVHADAVTATNAANSATASKNAAAASATTAANSAIAADGSKAAAQAAATAADASKTAAATSASDALASKNAAAASATGAATSASDALASKNAAKTSETNAGVSAGQASVSASNAQGSANAAGASQTAAAASATTATNQANAAAGSATAALASKNAAAVSEANAAASAALYPDAPSDNKQYGRKNAVWAEIVAGSADWATITNKPATFPPTLPIAQAGITNLVADLAAKAGLASPVFTGTPKSTTPATADNDVNIATTAFVKNQGYAAPPFPQSFVTNLTADLNAKAPIAGPAFTGNGTITGSFTVGASIISTNGNFGSGAANAVLAAGGGSVYLYPNGFGNAAGRMYVMNTGDMFTGGDIYCGSGVFSAASAGNAYLAAVGGNIILRPAGSTNTTGQGVYANGGNFTIAGATATKASGTAWVAASDERIKTVTGDYEMGLAEIVALQPRRFTYKGNETQYAPGTDYDNPDEPVIEDQGAAPYSDSPHYQMAVDGIEVVGLLAQEAEAAGMSDLVITTPAFIDGAAVDDLRSIDVTNVTYALINAVKELTARIEQLEAV